MIRKVKDNIFAVIIALLIFAGFAGYLFGNDGEFSETENRFLAKRPALTLSSLSDGSFMERFELYTMEQLPFRDAFINLKSFAGKMMLKNENNGIVLGSDGYLFEKLISTGEQFEKNKAQIYDFAGSGERDINICIIPNSCEIKKDCLPAGFPGVSQREEIEEFYNGLSAYDNVTVADVGGILNEHADEYIYYRTDHHWTTLGAYYGYRRLCDVMGLEGLDAEKLEGQKRTRDGFYGTYYSKYRGGGIKPDTITYYDIPVSRFETGGTEYESMYDEDKLETYDKYAMFMHGNEGLSVIGAADDGRVRRDELILFKDSYSNCLIPFLTYDYDSIIVVDLRYYGESVSGLLKEHPSADVLIMYNFMFFVEDNHFYRLSG
ncbi:MAG: hypothetical protein K6F34_07530 [Lachnospiraceae bacterium]|nr:hypothetical protein [Lachnospiraceae bacterium]